MGAPDANISRDIFDERKRYRRAVAQQGVPLVDADENDASKSLATYTQRIMQQALGDGWINDGFKIVEADSSGHRSSDPADNFVVAGSDLSAHAGEDIDDPYLTGAFMLEGLRAVLFGDVEYKPDDSFPDPPGNPEPISAQSIFPRVEDVNEGGGNTTVVDTAQQYKVNELVGRSIHVLGSGLAPQAITANTATEITFAGSHSSSINRYDRYVITLTAPTIADPGTREDGVYLNMYLDQINAQEDPSLYHAIGGAVECKIREQVIQEIFVREDIGTHGDWINELDDVDGQYRYTDADGNLHYVVKLASIERAGAGHVDNANIRNSMITNLQGEFAFGLTNSPFLLMGSAEYADHTTDPDNIPVHSVNGWPEVPEGYPSNAVYIARKEDDNANPAGFYGNTAGSWVYLYNVEVEDASDVNYTNQSSGLDTWISSPADLDTVLSEISAGMDTIAAASDDASEIAYTNVSGGTDNHITSPSNVDAVLSELSDAIDNNVIQYTMEPGDGITEWQAIVDAIVASGSGTRHQITFMPGSYNLSCPNQAVAWDFGSHYVTITSYGRQVTNVNFNKNAGQSIQTAIACNYQFRVFGINLGDLGDWDHNSDIIFDCDSYGSHFEDMYLDGSAGGINMTLINAGNAATITNIELFDDCRIVVDNNAYISNIKGGTRVDITAGNDCIITDCNGGLGVVSMGERGVISNCGELGGAVTQLSEGKIINCRVDNPITITQGNSGTIENAFLYNTSIDIIQGDGGRCILVGDGNRFHQLTQGDNSQFSATEARLFGDYCLQAGDYHWIEQGDNSHIFASSFHVTDYNPVESGTHVIKQGQDCTITGIKFYANLMGETWSTSSKVMHFITQSYRGAISNVTMTLNCGNAWTGNNIRLHIFNLSNQSRLSNCLCWTTGTGFTDSGTGNGVFVWNVNYMSLCYFRNMGAVPLYIDTSHLSTCYIDGDIIGASVKITGSYVTGDIISVREASGNQIIGDITVTSSVYAHIVGNQLDNVVGNGSSIGCNVSNNSILGNVSGGGSHLTDNYIGGSTTGTWVRSHDNI